MNFVVLLPYGLLLLSEALPFLPTRANGIAEAVLQAASLVGIKPAPAPPQLTPAVIAADVAAVQKEL